LSYFFQTTLVCLALFYFLNLIDVVFYSFLFSFQCPLTWLSRRVPIYITIPSPFCKAFFLYFFIFFYLSLFFCLYINVFFIDLFWCFFMIWCLQTILSIKNSKFYIPFICFFIKMQKNQIKIWLFYSILLLLSSY